MKFGISREMENQNITSVGEVWIFPVTKQLFQLWYSSISPSDFFSLLFRLYKITCVFLFGALVNLLFTLVGKTYLGELRPHFLALCKPNMSLVDCSEGYVTNYECTGKDFAAIEKAR